MNDKLENERGITIRTSFDNEEKIIEREVIKVDKYTTLIYTKGENSTSVAIIGLPDLSSELLSKQISKVLEADTIYFDTETTDVDLGIISNERLVNFELLYGNYSEDYFIKEIDFNYKEPNFKYNYFEDKKANRFINRSKRTKCSKKR